MTKFARLASEQKRVAKKTDHKAAEKRALGRVMSKLRGFLNIRGSLPQSAGRYLMHAGRLIVRNGDDDHLEDLVNECTEYMNGFRSAAYGKRPMLFYYYLKEHRLSGMDQLAYDAYVVTLQELDFGDIVDDIRPTYFNTIGQELCDRLRGWLGTPEEAGNDFETVLMDYMSSVMRKASRFKKSLLRNPNSLLGDYGWRTWLEHVDEEYGGRVGYLLPTKAERADNRAYRNSLAPVRAVMEDLLNKGDMAAYDEVGHALAMGDIAKLKEHGITLEAANVGG